jgi:hypothetical protein
LRSESRPSSRFAHNLVRTEFQLLIASLFPENAALRDALTGALTPGDSGNDGDDGDNAKTGRDEKDKKPRPAPKGRRGATRRRREVAAFWRGRERGCHGSA